MTMKRFELLGPDYPHFEGVLFGNGSVKLQVHPGFSEYKEPDNYNYVSLWEATDEWPWLKLRWIDEPPPRPLQEIEADLAQHCLAYESDQGFSALDDWRKKRQILAAEWESNE